MHSWLRISIAVGGALAASAAFAASKDSVTIGMALEPPGLDPTTGARRRDRRDRALQHLRGADEDQRGLLGHAAARRKMDVLARPQDADLHAQAGRQVPGRRAVHLQGREILVRALRAPRTRPTRTRRSSPRSSRSTRSDPATRRAEFKEPSFDGAVPSRPEHRRHHRREERGERGDQPGRHRPLQARLTGTRALR